MKVLNKFTFQNLKLNKKRTIVTIIGIVLSTALICAVAGMVTSFRQTLVDLAVDSKGNFHTEFKDVGREKLKYIEQGENINSYFYTATVGTAKLEGSKNDEKPYITVQEHDKVAMQNYGLSILEGRLPKNSNEVIIGENVISSGRVNIKVGDKLTLELGTLVEDGENISKDKIENISKKEYTVVGIMRKPSFLVEPYGVSSFTAITLMEKVPSRVNAFVEYNNPRDYNDSVKVLSNSLYGKKVDKGAIFNNQELLRAQGAIGERAMTTIYILAAIVIGIVVATSIFVIRNSFAISVSEKNKQYGMMASVGATSKQIKKSVLFEGFLIGIIAVPLGIAVGILAVIIIVAIVNGIIGDMLNGYSFAFSVPFAAMGGAIILSTVTIYFSCLRPARKAAKISPVESIRGNADINIKGKKLRTSKLTKKLFGIGGVIASKNLKRSRKKYRTTVISIVTSIFIFVSLASFMECGEKITSVYYAEVKYDIWLYGTGDKIYDKIAKMKYVEDYAKTTSVGAQINKAKYVTEFGKKVIGSNNDTKEKDVNVSIIVYNKEYYKKYLKSLGVSTNDYKNTGILIDDYKGKDEEGKSVLKNIYNIKNGETFTVKIDGKNRKVTNLYRTDERPMGQESVYYNTGAFVVSEEFLNEYKSSDSMFIKSSDCTKLENTLNDLVKQNDEYKDLKIDNFETLVEQQNRMYLLIAIFLYGFISVITLIGITNIFNTITTNMILRSKEFAMLKSVGMTTKEFNRMIRLESIMYGLKSLLIGLLLGIAGSYAVYTAFANELEMGYTLPIKAIILSIVFVFIIIGLTMKYSLNKINKQNIIETIRKDNI